MPPDTGQQVTINGVSLWELDGSGGVGYADGKMQGQRLFLCDWEDRQEALKALVGYLITNPEGTTSVSVAANRLSLWPALACKDVQVEGVGELGKDANEEATYDYAKLTATYRPDVVSEEDEGGSEAQQVLSTHRVSGRAEYITLGPGALVKTSGSKPVIDTQVMLRILQEHTIEKGNLKIIPSTTISVCLGAVNDAKFLGVGAGYLLCSGADSSEETMADGKKRYSMTYRFLQASDKWNSVRQAGGVVDTNGPYLIADFNTIPVGAT